MTITFDVQVLDDENPVEGAEVEAYFSENEIISNFLKSGRQIEETDEDGHATFNCTMTHDSVVFYCRGQKFGPYEVDDGESFTLNL